jgi:hypothetical protein
VTWIFSALIRRACLPQKEHGNYGNLLWLQGPGFADWLALFRHRGLEIATIFPAREDLRKVAA